MNILVVHNLYKQTGIGGEDQVYKNEVKLLNEYGDDINVYTYDVCNEDINRFKIIFSIYFSIFHFRNIYKLVKKYNIDIMHVHNFFPLLTTSIFKAGKKAGAKVILTLHNYRLWCISGILFRKNKHRCHDCINGTKLNGIFHKCYRKSFLQSIFATVAFKFYSITRSYKYIDAFFVLTQFQFNIVKDLLPKKSEIFVKPNTVDTTFYESEDRYNFLFVGLLEESKGVLRLIDVWKELDSSYVLNIVGVGSLYDKIEKLNLPNVRLLGRQPFTRVQELMLKSKYLLQTSIWYETFGLTIVEALSLGTPVIGFNIGTRPEFITNEVNGYLCKPENLKETLVLANNNPNYDIMRKNAYESSKRFKADVIMSDQVRIYKEILEG